MCPIQRAVRECRSASSFVLSTRRGNKAYIEPIVDHVTKAVRFEVKTGLKNTPVIRTFEHIEVNPQGKIVLTFTPRANLATVSAIQIEDEGASN